MCGSDHVVELNSLTAAGRNGLCWNQGGWSHRQVSVTKNKWNKVHVRLKVKLRLKVLIAAFWGSCGDVTEVVGMFLDNRVTVKISETKVFFTCFCYTDFFFFFTFFLTWQSWLNLVVGWELNSKYESFLKEQNFYLFWCTKSPVFSERQQFWQLFALWLLKVGVLLAVDCPQFVFSLLCLFWFFQFTFLFKDMTHCVH